MLPLSKMPIDVPPDPGDNSGASQDYQHTRQVKRASGTVTKDQMLMWRYRVADSVKLAPPPPDNVSDLDVFVTVDSSNTTNT